MGAHILIVEDEEALSVLLRYNLEREGYEVETVSRGDEAETKLCERVPDLLVLDWMLPGVSGIELCRRLRMRPETKSLPIIMLTARGQESERVRGLATGADDYIVKPFSVPELIARVRALLRRFRSEPRPVRIEIGDIEIDPNGGAVKKDGKAVGLTKTEFNLLRCLAERPNQVFSRETLLERVWGYDYLGDSRLVDVHVRRLRAKIETDPASPTIIVTVRGLGYKASNEP